MYKLTELIASKDLQAKEFAQQLKPYLVNREAEYAFEMYSMMVRERTEYETLKRILKTHGFNEAIDNM